jgi:hypothetical protein
MKKTIIVFAAMVVVLGAAATDRFHIEEFTISPGETRTVSILLDNEAEYTAFQSDLYLPEGLTAANFALTDRKNANHTLTATVLPDGGIRLLSYSLNLKTYSGNSGALVTFDVTVSEDFEGEATVALRGTLFTTVAGVEVPFDNETCTVSLPSTAIRGDVTGDSSVNISDVTALIDYLLSGNPSGVNLTAADCNQDSSINISDVTALIDYLLSGSWN